MIIYESFHHETPCSTSKFADANALVPTIRSHIDEPPTLLVAIDARTVRVKGQERVAPLGVAYTLNTELDSYIPIIGSWDIVVKDQVGRLNDNEKSTFSFGETMIMSLEEIRTFVQEMLEDFQGTASRTLMFAEDIKGVTGFMENIGAGLEEAEPRVTICVSPKNKEGNGGNAGNIARDLLEKAMGEMRGRELHLTQGRRPYYATHERK